MSLCVRIAPMAKAEASTSSSKGLSILGWHRTGSLQIRVINFSSTSPASLVHLKGPSVVFIVSVMGLLDKQSVIVDMSVKPTPCTQGHIAQWLEHPVYNREVLGSNPSLVIF